MARIGGDHAVASTDRALDDGDINDVVMAGLADQDPNSLSQFLAHRLDVAHPQHPSQAQPAALRRAMPGRGLVLGRGDDLFGDEAGMQLPHRAIVALGGDKRAGVVGDPAHGNQAEFRSTLP